MDTSKFIENGKLLGLDGKDLMCYVEAEEKKFNENIKLRIEQEERKRVADDERDKRAHEREMRKLEIENKEKEYQLELIRSGNVDANVGVVNSKPNIKLTNYRDGDDIAVYFKTVEKVKTANGWDESVTLSALINAFSGTRVSAFLNNLPSTLSYEEIKLEIIKSFGLNIFDYQKKFHSTKQGSESFRQYVLTLREFITKMCNLASVNNDFDLLEELIVKDQLLHSINKDLAEYLKERELFKLGLEEVIMLAENYQSIHGKGFKSKGNYSNANNVSNSKLVADSDYQKPLICYSCNKEGHKATNCPARSVHNAQTSVKPNGTRNFANRSNYQQRKNYETQSVIKSRNYSKDKSIGSKPRSEKIDVVNVSISGELSYKDGKLPLVKGTCNDKEAIVMRDTGATHVVVNSKYVTPEHYTEEVASVTLADGSTKTGNMAVVQINSPFFTGKIKAVSLKDSKHDVLIGNVQGAKCICSVPDCMNITENDYSVCAVETRSAKIKDLQTCDKKKALTSLGITTDTLILEQFKDSKIEKLFDKVNSVDGSYPKFQRWNNGVLVRISNRSKKAKNLVTQVVLPQVYVGKILNLAHDTLMSGHLGIRKTQDRILTHFYWPGCYTDIRRYCRSCEICQRFSKDKPAKVPLVSVPVIGKPFQKVCMDLIGPLPRSRKGNRYALVSVDMATKYPDVVTLKHIDSLTVAEALIQIYSRVGLPQEIVHDQGTQFMSAVMRKFNELLKIKSIYTTPFHPMANGQCENFNKTLKQMLRKFADEDPLNWDKYIQPMLFAYREVPQLSTGFSPFELLFGYEVRGPLFLLKHELLDESTDSETLPVTDYVVQMRTKVREFMRAANENEMHSKTKEKTYYDKRTRNRKFKIGDKVLLLLPTSSSKLLAEWKGPYEVIRKLNKVDYLIRIGDRERSYHINMLKAFHERNAVTNSEVNSALETDISLIIPEQATLGSNVYSTDAKLSCNSKYGSNYSISNNLSLSENKQLFSVLSEYKDIFSLTPGRITGVEHRIYVDANVKPVASKPYKIPFHLKTIVRDELEKMEAAGVIRKSSSEWVSPAVVVTDQNKKFSRLAIDYRKVNPHISNDNFPMPEVEVVIQKLQDAKYLTKLDFTKAFYQIPLTPDSWQYTSFVTEFGQYEYTVVPFGMKFCSGICNRVISNILRECTEFVTNFVDDLVVHSSTFSDHLYHVAIVLEKLMKAGITLKNEKCLFASNSIDFLGFRISNGSVKPIPEKVETIQKFPLPRNKKALRSFLGMINFYRKFVPHLATVIAPLTDLLKKCHPDKIYWSKVHLDCFNKALNLFSDDVSLYIPKINANFVVQTDASEVGIGAILWQVIEDESRPISFISRKLNEAERNYAVIEKECLAIMWAVSKFHEFLVGKKFVIRTDHAPLQWLQCNKNKNSKLTRWALALQEYEFSIEYIKGSDNFLADTLSRNTIESEKAVLH